MAAVACRKIQGGDATANASTGTASTVVTRELSETADACIFTHYRFEVTDETLSNRMICITLACTTKRNLPFKGHSGSGASYYG